jgi:hypothetical protein
MPRDYSGMPADRVVEIYAAANAIEAHALCAVLAEEAIQAQIVGEQLGNAAGCLPLGETLAPRIWVREGDATRAREIIEEWISQPRQEWGESLESDDQGEIEEEPEKDTPLAPGVQLRRLGQGFVIVGVVCILVGIVWACLNWMTLHKFQGMAEGVLVGGRPHTESDIPTASDDNIPGPRRQPSFSVRYELQYEFVVEGRAYYILVQDGNIDDRRVPIHYDLHNPERNLLGPLTRPWTILFSTWGIGVLLSLVGCYCRRKPAGHSRECNILAAAGDEKQR